METPHNSDLYRLMELATRDDLANFVADYARENKGFKDELMAFLKRKFIGNETTAEDYVAQMQRAFTETKDVGGEWRSCEVKDWNVICHEASNVLQEGQKLLELGNADAAVMIAAEFFHQVDADFDESLFYNDSDEFTFQYTCEDAEKLLVLAIGHPDISKTIQAQTITELKGLKKGVMELADYGQLDYDDLLVKVSAEVMPADDSLQLIDKQLELHKGTPEEHTYVERKIDFLRKIGRNADADKTEMEYLHLPQIRSALVDRLVGNREYTKAAEYVKGGIGEAEAQDGVYLAVRWRKRLLDIYEQTGETSEQVKTARELFVQTNGDTDYYHKLKALVPEDEWKDFLDKLIADTQFADDSFYGSSHLADIYVEEGDKEKLYQHVVAHSDLYTSTLDHYGRYVGDVHAEELLDIYERLLKKEAAGQANVKKYGRIAASMSCMQKLSGGTEAVHRLAEYFRSEYRRRPAFMAEIAGF